MGRKQIVAITSGMGSIIDCSSNMAVPYRVSKSGLNMAVQSFAKQSEKDKDGVTACLINPGWVQTDLGGNNATKTVRQSIQQMLDNVIDKNESLVNGGFYTYTGEPFAAEKAAKNKFGW